MNLKHETLRLATTLDRRSVEYAVCGAVAVAMYGFVRATTNVDVLVLSTDMAQAIEQVSSLGFASAAERRGRKKPPAGTWTATIGTELQQVDLHLIPVTSAFEDAWRSRMKVGVDNEVVQTISRDQLILLGQHSPNLQHQVDIERLIEPASHDPFLPPNMPPASMEAREVGRRLRLQSQLLQLCWTLGSAKFVGVND